MQIERALQPNHSETMRLVASFADDETAKQVRTELVRHLEEVFARSDKFSCASFGRSFDSEEELEAWKAKEWTPVADERSALEIKPQDNGRIYVHGNYGLILDDWSRDDVGIALDDCVVALRTYTAGYGIDYLHNWLSEKGGDVHVEIEGCEYEYEPLDWALEALQAALG